MGLGSILVVDDDQDLREIVAEVLELEGYLVSTAANGAVALEMIAAMRAVDRESPALIILDMRMPVLDGWGFARELKERGWEIPIVVQTAAVSARTWAEEVGAAAFLDKPFDMDELIGLVKRRVAGTHSEV